MEPAIRFDTEDSATALDVRPALIQSTSNAHSLTVWSRASGLLSRTNNPGIGGEETTPDPIAHAAERESIKR